MRSAELIASDYNIESAELPIMILIILFTSGNETELLYVGYRRSAVSGNLKIGTDWRAVDHRWYGVSTDWPHWAMPVHCTV